MESVATSRKVGGGARCPSKSKGVAYMHICCSCAFSAFWAVEVSTQHFNLIGCILRLMV